MDEATRIQCDVNPSGGEFAAEYNRRYRERVCRVWMTDFVRPTRNVGAAIGEWRASHMDECEYSLDGSGDCGPMIRGFYQRIRDDIARKHGFIDELDMLSEAKQRVTAKWAWDNMGV